MKVKKYTGNSLEKIRSVIVKELGEDAVIVNIRKNSVTGGLLAMGRKASFEVIAAVEEATDADSADPAKTPVGAEAFDEFLKIQRDQYRGLRQSIKMLDDKLAEVDGRIRPPAAAGAVSGAAVEKELANVHDRWRPLVLDHLHRIAGDRQPVAADWQEALAGLIPTAGGILFRKNSGGGPDVYVITGPTGVGKTTTLAKLAAKCVLGERLNVGLITSDTFRVAAVDQLREYSSLLGVEITVAFSAEELELQLQHFHDKDVVFVDTPGRSPYDTEGIGQIHNMLRRSGEKTCTLLVFPANIRREDAECLFSGYGILKPSALIVSKTDEASRCDGITAMLELSQLPILYLTDGQRVPEDIHCASPGLVASLIMPFARTDGDAIKMGGEKTE
ncbi:MAG: hypothetical protein PHQ27_02480 [Victivallales bacterium]|nr:hypothetical protein [Victivallales bacterium]